MKCQLSGLQNKPSLQVGLSPLLLSRIRRPHPFSRSSILLWPLPSNRKPIFRIKIFSILFIRLFRCNKQETCRLAVDESVFEDPCPDTSKYLQVDFECVKHRKQRVTSSPAITVSYRKSQQVLSQLYQYFCAHFIFFFAPAGCNFKQLRFRFGTKS